MPVTLQCNCVKSKEFSVDMFCSVKSNQFFIWLKCVKTCFCFICIVLSALLALLFVSLTDSGGWTADFGCQPRASVTAMLISKGTKLHWRSFCLDLRLRIHKTGFVVTTQLSYWMNLDVGVPRENPQRHRENMQINQTPHNSWPRPGGGVKLRSVLGVRNQS